MSWLQDRPLLVAYLVTVSTLSLVLQIVEVLR